MAMRSRISLRAIVACGLLLAAAPASSEVYRWTDENGRMHFTSDKSKVPARYRHQADQPTGSGRSTINRVESRGRQPWDGNRQPQGVRSRSATSSGSRPARRMDAFAEKPAPVAKPVPKKYERDCTGSGARCRSWVNPEWKRWKQDQDARKRKAAEDDDF
jgi:hypothetical protein